MGHTNIEIKQKRMMSVNVKTLNRCEGYISTMELFNIASITLDYGLIMGDEQPSFSFYARARGSRHQGEYVLVVVIVVIVLFFLPFVKIK